MGRKWRHITFDYDNLQRHQTKGDIPCFRCDKKFKHKDKIIAKAKGYSRTRYYHEDCLLSMYQ